MDLLLTQMAHLFHKLYNPDQWKVLSTQVHGDGSIQVIQQKESFTTILQLRESMMMIQTTPNKQFIIDGWRVPTRNDFESTLNTYLKYYGYTPIHRQLLFVD